MGKLAGGRVTLRFRKPGYISRSVAYNVRPGAHVKGVLVHMSPTGVVAGRIIRSDGKPAPNVFVTAYRYQNSTEGRQLVSLSPNGSTNDLGEFRLVELAPGRYLIGMASGLRGWGYESAPDPLAVPPILYPGVGTVSQAQIIDVVGGEENRLKDVTLSSIRFGMLRIHFTNSRAGTTSDPSFELGYVTRSIVEDGRSQNLGEYLPKRTIRFDSAAETSITYWPNRPGVFSVVLRWKDGEGKTIDSRTPIQFDGTNTDVKIALERPDEGRLDIRGRIENTDGTLVPLSGVTLGVCRMGASECASQAFWMREQTALPRLDSDGKVSVKAASGQYDLHFINIPEGFYLGTVTQAGHDVLTEGMLASDNAPIVEIMVKPNPAIVRGSVRDRAGNLVENALVTLLPDTPLNATKLQSLRPSTRTDENGYFELRDVIPGKYRAYSCMQANGDVYPDQEFLMEFLEDGTALQVKEREEVLVNLALLAPLAAERQNH